MSFKHLYPKYDTQYSELSYIRTQAQAEAEIEDAYRHIARLQHDSSAVIEDDHSNFRRDYKHQIKDLRKKIDAIAAMFLIPGETVSAIEAEIIGTPKRHSPIRQIADSLKSKITKHPNLKG